MMNLLRLRRAVVLLVVSLPVSQSSPPSPSVSVSEEVDSQSDASNTFPQCSAIGNNNNNNSTCQAPTAPFQCSLYLAPSTIPGAGLGIFSGIERHKGDTVGEGDVVLPIADVWFHLQASKLYQGSQADTPENLDPTQDYVWHGPEMGMMFESSDAQHYVTAFAPGLDAAINCNLALINVDKDVPQYDTSGLHRSKDPGAGAFTPYHNSTSEVTAHVPAGGELFKYYGVSWFTTREEWFGPVPFREDYPRAEELVKAFEQQVGQQQFTNEVRSELHHWMMTTGDLATTSRTLLALPKTVSHFESVAQEGIRAYYQKSATRTIDDLQATGRCLDTITPKRSTLPQAGRGAFANKAFETGEVITGTPLLYTPRSDFMKIYHGDWYNLSESAPTSFRGYSIVMNYCWHHESSGLYLFPYGYGVNYINHNRTLANVKMQWTPSGVMNQHSEYLTLSPEAMEDDAAPGLVMDIVATREIQAGEELFLDYGSAWEAAWQEHVREFESRHAAQYADYISAREWNERYGNVIIKTVAEQKNTERYPENLMLRCLEEIAEPLVTLTPAQAKELWTIDNPGVLCVVVARRVEESSGSVLYKVRYEVYDEEEEESSIEESDWIIREAMQMFDRPYTTDIWLETAFRHPIGIPDDVFPEAWRGFGLDEKNGDEL